MAKNLSGPHSSVEVVHRTASFSVENGTVSVDR